MEKSNFFRFVALIVLLISVSSKVSASHPVALVRVVDQVAKLANASRVATVEIAGTLSRFILTNQIYGFEFSPKESASILKIGDITTEEGQKELYHLLGDKRYQKFISSLKATIYMHSLLGEEGYTLTLRKNLLLDSDVAGILKEVEASSSVALGRDRVAFNHSFTNEIETLLKDVTPNVRSNFLKQAREMYKAALKEPSFREVYKKIIITRAKITSSFKKVVGRSLHYFSVNGANGVCKVKKNISNLLKLDQAFLKFVQNQRGIASSELSRLYRLAFAETLTRGDVTLAGFRIKELASDRACLNVSSLMVL